MKQLIEAHCKGIFRSYKTFRTSGQVVLHTIQNFQEWDFNDDHLLTITAYQQHRKKTICNTDQWELEFNNKQHFIHIRHPEMLFEVISVNHTGMVIADRKLGEKVFFARFPASENLIKKSLPVF